MLPSEPRARYEAAGFSSGFWVALAVVWPLAVRAQQANKIFRIGFITGPRAGPSTGPALRAFFGALRAIGFSEGGNLVADVRWVEEDVRGPSALAADLVRQKADLLVTDGTEDVLRAAVEAGPDLPVVMIATNFDPIARGYVKTLARPGGNVTGVFAQQPELAQKQVELLTQAFPKRTRLAVFYDAGSSEQFSAAERQAVLLGLELRALKLDQPPYDFTGAFRTLDESAPHVLLVLSSPLFNPHRKQIADLAIQRKLPTMFIFRSYVDAGGFMSYGVDRAAMFRAAGAYVGKILKGENPADLPVEQPTKFELVVNLTTAKAIGIEVPTSILLRADEVIE